MQLLTPLEDDGSRLSSIPEAVEELLACAPRHVPKGSAHTTFLHRNPHRHVFYGGWLGKSRAPVVFLEAPSPDVIAYLADDPQGPFRFPAMLKMQEACERWGFEEDKLEALLKADWHTVPHLGSEAELFVPRHAKPGSLMRAPPRLVAFIVALRVVNKPCWSAIATVLRNLGKAHQQDGMQREGRVLGSIAECFANQRHFGAVEAQVWSGGRARRLPSHKDGAPSLLHLGLTLSGRRTLRAGVFRSSMAPGNPPLQLADLGANPGGQVAGLPMVAKPGGQVAGLPVGVGNVMASGGPPYTGPLPLAIPYAHDPFGAGEKNVWDEDVWKRHNLQEMAMAPGSVYLSSPFCFEHAVAYEACPASDPVVALQCRFGFPDDLGPTLNNLRNFDMLEVATVIAEGLLAASRRGLLRMPSLKEVARAHEQLVNSGALPAP